MPKITEIIIAELQKLNTGQLPEVDASDLNVQFSEVGTEIIIKIKKDIKEKK